MIDMGVDRRKARSRRTSRTRQIASPLESRARTSASRSARSVRSACEGTVEDLGGCHTCTNCNAQLKCGL
ncbi:MAG: hypothetical protein MZU97_15810 [Bacillus subtilis]|nr:hypothetical protein [Bacillus subtilis]